MPTSPATIRAAIASLEQEWCALQGRSFGAARDGVSGSEMLFIRPMLDIETRLRLLRAALR